MTADRKAQEIPKQSDGPYLTLEQGFRSAQKAVVLKRNNFCEHDIFAVHTSPLFDNGTGPIPPGFSIITLPTPSGQ
jgi:hypothetical protein